MNYTTLTFSELVEKIGKARYWNLPKMLQEVLNRLTPEVVTPESKVYKALITQTNTDEPTIIVLKNELGSPIVWTRDDAGVYFGDLQGAFTEDKVFCQIANPDSDMSAGEGSNEIARTSNDRILIVSRDNTFAPADNYLYKTSINIEIFN